jgi:hypothetical protein
MGAPDSFNIPGTYNDGYGGYGRCGRSPGDQVAVRQLARRIGRSSQKASCGLRKPAELSSLRPVAKTKLKDRVPHDVALIRQEIRRFLSTKDENGRTPCNCRCGVYVFYDYDGEPIYVGQSEERLRTRIRRHLTNQRTDAVAMNVLDPFEVADVEVYPLYELESAQPRENKKALKERRKAILGAAEYAVFQRVLKASALGAVLNEKDIAKSRLEVKLPPPFRGRIIPDSLFEERKHADVRIARRGEHGRRSGASDQRTRGFFRSASHVGHPGETA